MSLVTEQRKDTLLSVAQALQEAGGLAGGIRTCQHQCQTTGFIRSNGGAQLVVDHGIRVAKSTVDNTGHKQLLRMAGLQLL